MNILSNKFFINEIQSILDNPFAYDGNFLANNSYKDHHVKGLDYYCLKRSHSETWKIYDISPSLKNNQGFLVHPHTHRYNFSTIVLSGVIGHVRFSIEDAEKHSRNSVGHYVYNFCHETKKAKLRSHIEHCLLSGPEELYQVGQSYYVKTNEIHTLKTTYPFNNSRTILGLIQEKDTNLDANLFIPCEENIEATGAAMNIREYTRGLGNILNVLGNQL